MPDKQWSSITRIWEATMEKAFVNILLLSDARSSLSVALIQYANCFASAISLYVQSKHTKLVRTVRIKGE